jgi:hypothetical protein
LCLWIEYIPNIISQRVDCRCNRACVDVVEEVKTALFAMFFLVGAVGAQAGSLDTLKAAAKSYVAAMENALGLSEASSCPQIIAVANEYAKAKIAYYCAARAAMPLLLQSADPLHRSRGGPKQEKLFLTLPSGKRDAGGSGAVLNA